jgi:hypothetical protein
MLSKAERQRNALLAEREAECRRLRMEVARYRVVLMRVRDAYDYHGDCLRTSDLQAVRDVLAAAEQESSEPETIDLMAVVGESCEQAKAEREPSEATPEGGDQAQS